jgi:hypothetical protein
MRLIRKRLKEGQTTLKSIDPIDYALTGGAFEEGGTRAWLMRVRELCSGRPRFRHADKTASEFDLFGFSKQLFVMKANFIGATGACRLCSFPENMANNSRHRNFLCMSRQ